MITDQQLWQKLKDGHEDALEQIYREHVDALLRYGGQFCRDASLIEDCLHDLFVDLWRNREGLRDNDNIRPYLLVALRRKLIRQIGKLQKTQNERDTREVDFLAEPAIDESIIGREISEANARALKQAMAQLSKRQREVLYLKYFEDMSYEDICEALGINYQSVRNLVSTGIKALRKYLTVLWLIFLNFFLAN
ncbi:RNA polymerase sigma factor [Flavilitoribacter nigricans]|uniref:RNA polymerase subunit sigma n=1 Tax=Flavilitoribacter nigricans (strain ATCC 23147 / DSM 23189 / NBRC 102662 / NCIMB 1420 / SS-2) TaxID=1122177 RepID=A0A2D0NCU5_FLAN2|nr:sigma-70 family RNA polymerase sigma factor [Flavilitoribacter nigricans]PHN05593.1 RNA polymerase subunit sigma [Flavilitoribacter nigricans DSM 23189 = NBRC 102662]